MQTIRVLVVFSLLASATTPSVAPATGQTADEHLNGPANVAPPNEAPLADAGLDQTVARGTTVYLDAGKSRDPDGDIVDYAWTIDRESGTGTTANETTGKPACADCEQTHFRPDATGTYNVTLAVTDDDQTTRTDSLFVEVRAGEPPSVSLASPTRTTTGEATRVTADVTSGAAPLRRLVWRIDGERVATDRLSGDANTTTQTTRFPTTGTHSVSVVAIDEDDQRGTATRDITVVDPALTVPDADTDTTVDSSDGSQPPDVTGPRVVTGHGSLDASYGLTGDERGTWMLDGSQVGTGSGTTVSLSPGVHEIYAATNGGVATFPDGNRHVVADPAPDLSVENLSDASVVPVDVHATDEFGNLQSVTIEVDGEPIETHTIDKIGGTQTGRSFSTVDYLDSLEPGSHAITVRARDARGQTAVAVRTVTIPGPPEVVSAGFVQDGPLDQYHPRIDESRYTATYQVTVKLNGVSPDAMSAWIRLGDNYHVSDTEKLSIRGSEYLVFKKEAYRNRLGPIEAESDLLWRQNHRFGASKDRVNVTPADPEIRISPYDYQSRHETGRGIGLDASESFDPDRTELRYVWNYANGGEVNDSNVFLDTFDYTYLEVSDKQNGVSKSGNLISWLIPEPKVASSEDSGPYYPNETVTFTVWSEQFLLTKPTYEDLLSYNLRTEAGRVTKSTLLESAPDGFREPNTLYFPRWHKWTVEVPARAFLDGSPNVTVYGTDHPIVEHGLSLPEPEVYIPTTNSIEDVSTDIDYRVERPTSVTRRTTNEDVRDSLLDEGYAVSKTSNAGHEYQLEEYQKVEEASYDVDRMEFRQRGRRSHYLSLNSDWEAAGSSTKVDTWTTTENVWRSSRSGDGTYTGETRRKLVEEGDYRTEKQFEYEDTETYQTTVTYQDTYTTTETEVSYKEQCFSFGCVKYQTTSTETVHHTVTRTKTVTRTRTVDRTYWSTRPRHLSHDYTGNIRRITVSEPEYERQYQFQVEREHRETNTVYHAERRTLTEPAEYEWRPTETVSTRMQAETVAMASDVRIGDVVPAIEWVLEKQTGTETVRVSYLREDWNVLETIGEGDATLVQRYNTGGDKQLPQGQTKESTVSVELIEPGFVSKDTMENIISKELEDRSNA